MANDLRNKSPFNNTGHDTTLNFTGNYIRL